MSEKRFIFATNEKRFNLDDESRIWDNGTPMTALDIVMMLNEQQARIVMLEKGILDCLFEDKSIGMFALDMGLVE